MSFQRVKSRKQIDSVEHSTIVIFYAPEWEKVEDLAHLVAQKLQGEETHVIGLSEIDPHSLSSYRVSHEI